MKIAFVGKGGSGKTTACSLFVQYIASQGLPVVAIDADINQHLGQAVGYSAQEVASILPLGEHMSEIKEYLRGTNSRISSAEAMLKTTPAGEGSRLLRVNGSDIFHAHLSLRQNGITLMRTGAFTEQDLGVACYHSKIGAAELYLGHLVDEQKEYVVMDMTAGADAFASGLFARFDVVFLVVEPTLKSISVYQQYKEYSKGFGLTIKVIGNKAQDEDDIAFIAHAVGEDLLAVLGSSRYVKSCEKGRRLPFSDLEHDNYRVLADMLDCVDATPQDWRRFTRLGNHFHEKNALSWGNAKSGQQLEKQIDPTFVMGPQSLV